MEIEFRTKNNKQLQAAEAWLDPSVDEILYGGAKGGGKSYLGASLIFGAAHTYPETQWFIARKELIDLKKFTIPTIHEVHKNWGLDATQYLHFDGQLNVFTLPNGSKVFLIACADIPSDPMFERFGSMQMTGGWIEEGGEIAESAKANLRLSIGRWKNDEYGIKGKMLITANPKKGWMKRDFVDPSNQGVLPRNRRYIQAFSTDNVYLPKEYVETLRNEKDTVRRQRLFEGNWDYDEDQDSLISFDALTDAFSNAVLKNGQKYLIVDVARLGQDTTVFSFWNSTELYKVEQFSKQSTDTTEQKIKDFAAAEKIPYSHILIDEDGIGGGVVDHLFGVKGFMANSSPFPSASEIREKHKKANHFLVPKTNFANLKAQCGWKLAEMINERKIAFQVPQYRDQIIEELTAILRDKEVDTEGKKRLKSKEDVKAELGRSPDIGDTLLMRMYFELLKDSTGNYDESLQVVHEIQEVRFTQNRKNIKNNSAR